MPEKLERYSLIIAAIVQIFAVGWWTSALNETVDRQVYLTSKLESQLIELDKRVIRMETLIENRI